MPSLKLRSSRLRLRMPLRTAWGELRERDIFDVRLEWSTDDHGTGEAAPLEACDGVPAAAVRAALDAYREVLRRMPGGASHAELLEACAAERPLPQALAAIDLALWDRAARAAGRPVAQLIAPPAPRAVPVSATIASTDPVFAAAEAYRAAAAGYRCLKVKVGVGDDLARVTAVRHAVGPQVAMRVDAGGAWPDAETALDRLHPLAEAGIELAEDAVHDPTALGELRERSPIPVAIDAPAPGSAPAGWRRGDIVCVRISRCGGITGALEQARSARRAGAQVYVGSTYDGPLGIAAGIHTAAVLDAAAPVPACGLTTLGMFDEHAHMLPVDNGQIQVPSEPGLFGGTTRVK